MKRTVLTAGTRVVSRLVEKGEVWGWQRGVGREMYLVGVVERQNAATRLVDVLVAVVGAAHGQRRIHVHVVAGKVERNQALEHDGPAREGRRQEDEQARRGAAVRDHVKDGAEAGRLLKVPRSIAVEGVEEAGYAVQQRACAGMQGHVIERGDGEHDA